ncbi:hypothetical protein LSH36_157g04082 [Paralvinella palmiformis]|uniref:Uncharacterized protein n=1 Tax=Paralvinella palmiformis TaxID=53620 RepID=A0AAD9JVS1_9ANNE|nr:hypothetical protein LSH36_157g04082 [Paralvinella palmiformis]
MLIFPGGYSKEKGLFVYPKKSVIDSSYELPDISHCKELADAIRSLLRVYFNSTGFGRQTAIELGKMSFGFDVINDKQALEHFACSIGRSFCVEQLKTILGHLNDFNYRQFRLLYDYNLVNYAYAIAYTNKSNNRFETLKSIGLLSMDPEGLRYMAGTSDRINAPIRGSLQERCRRFQDLTWSWILSAPPRLTMKVSAWTGINMEDTRHVNAILCDIVGNYPNKTRSIEASDVSLRMVYKVLDDNNIVTSIYKKCIQSR